MTNITEIIKVDLRRIQDSEDWIVATSESEHLKGLYLANPSYDRVMSQIPNAIKMIYLAQGKTVDVQRVRLNNDTVKQSTDTVEFVAKAA